MTILDTKVISGTAKKVPDAAVAQWVRAHPALGFCTTSVTEAELLLGVEIMPAGRRRDALRREIEGILYEDLAGRILPFRREAARCYAEIVASRRRGGRPISISGGQIAAIAPAHGHRAKIDRATNEHE